MSMNTDVQAVRAGVTTPTYVRSRVHKCRPRSLPVLGTALFHLYGLPLASLKRLIIRLLHRLEGGSAFSVTLRRIFARYYDLEVGMYTHGGWIVPFNLDGGVKVGRYCSIAETARVMTRNHPVERKSTSALFYDPSFGLVDELQISGISLTIGNDVWIAHNAIILPGVTSIGDGAVIGAGTIVHKNVPPFAIVKGHPGRVVGYRFSEPVIRELLASCWWDKPLEELLPSLDSFLQPLERANFR